MKSPYSIHYFFRMARNDIVASTILQHMSQTDQWGAIKRLKKDNVTGPKIKELFFRVFPKERRTYGNQSHQADIALARRFGKFIMHDVSYNKIRKEILDEIESEKTEDMTSPVSMAFLETMSQGDEESLSILKDLSETKQWVTINKLKSVGIFGAKITELFFLLFDEVPDYRHESHEENLILVNKFAEIIVRDNAFCDFYNEKRIQLWGDWEPGDLPGPFSVDYLYHMSQRDAESHTIILAMDSTWQEDAIEKLDKDGIAGLKIKQLYQLAFPKGSLIEVGEPLSKEKESEAKKFGEFILCNPLYEKMKDKVLKK